MCNSLWLTLSGHLRWLSLRGMAKFKHFNRTAARRMSSIEKNISTDFPFVIRIMISDALLSFLLGTKRPQGVCVKNMYQRYYRVSVLGDQT